jgi:hypothetical protein
MMMDIDQAAKAVRDEEMPAEIEGFIEGFNSPPTAACRSTVGGSLPGQARTAGAGSNGAVQHATG